MRVNKFNPVMCDYLATVNNEIVFDSLYFEILKSSPDELGYLPRVPKWIRFGKSHPRLTRAVTGVLRAGWLGGGAVAFFVLQLLQLSWAIARAPRRARLDPSESCYVLALSSRTADINMPDERTARATWIAFPWTPISQLPAGATHTEYSQLLSFGDAWMAFLRAVRAVYLLAGRKRQKKWVLQSYTAFRWFAVRTVVAKLRGAVLMTEHFDRWAILVDSSFARRESSDTSTLTLVQHGGVEPVKGSATADASRIRLPRKLRAIDQLWVYDANSERIFRRDILSRRCNRRLSSINYFTPTIKLKRLDDFPGVRMLIVGSPLCERAHQELYQRLSVEFQLKVYYKPHPRATMSAHLKKIGWSVLRDATTFPEVELLVSYPSTLVTEYGTQGVESLVHPIDIAGDELDTFYQSIVGSLNRCKSIRVAE